MSHQYDLVIIGGGLVGASLLLALRHTGLKIALIEATEHIDRTLPELDQRSLVLSLGSKLLYQQLGVWGNIAGYTTEINQIKVSEQGCFNKVFLNKTSFGVAGLGYVVNIQLLNKAIWQSLEAVENIDIFCPYKLRDIQINSDSSELILADQNNKEQKIQSKIVIAADGGRSYVRDLLHIPYSMHDYQQLALIINVKHELANENIAYERFSKQGPLAILPRENKNISGIVWPWPAVQQDYIKNLSDKELLKKLQDLFGYKLGKFLEVGNRQFFPLRQVYSHELSKSRILLLGNAANHIHPVGGQGFNLGLRDVKCFSELLKKYKSNLINHDFCEAVVEQMFTEYKSLRYDDHYNLRTYTHSLLDLFASDKLIVKGLRRLGMTVMNHSLLMRTIIADKSMGLIA